MCAGTQTTLSPFCPADDKVNSLWLPWTPMVDEQSGRLSSWAALLLSVTWCASCDLIGKQLIGVGYNENRTLLQPVLGSTVTALTLPCGVNSINSMFYFSWEALSCFPIFLLLAYNTSSSVIPLFQLSPFFKAQVVLPWPQIHRFLRVRKPLAQQFQTFQVLGSKEGYSAANRWWMGPLSQTWFLPLPFQLGGSLMICFNLEFPCKMKWSVSHSVMSDSSWPHGLSPSGSSDHGIFQARILEWVAIPFSRGSSWPRDQTLASHIAGRLFTVWATRNKTLYDGKKDFMFKTKIENHRSNLTSLFYE